MSLGQTNSVHRTSGAAARSEPAAAPRAEYAFEGGETCASRARIEARRESQQAAPRCRHGGGALELRSCQPQGPAAEGSVDRGLAVRRSRAAPVPRQRSADRPGRSPSRRGDPRSACLRAAFRRSHDAVVVARARDRVGARGRRVDGRPAPDAARGRCGPRGGRGVRSRRTPTCWWWPAIPREPSRYRPGAARRVHAAQHGLGGARPMDDLRRALQADDAALSLTTAGPW